MERMKPSKRSWLFRVGLLLPGLLAGCYSYEMQVDNGSTIPPGAIPAPVGTYVNKFIDLQAAKAEADDFVVYNHEWYLGGRDLGPYGRYHLNEMAKRLPSVPFPVVIEPTVDEELNEERRRVIVLLLERYRVPNPNERVILAFPMAGGLYGREAEALPETFFSNAAAAQQYSGFGFGTGSGFGSNFGAGQLGGGFGARNRFFGGGFFGGGFRRF
jgi:hypothetical protein